ncbi:hypothetical protein MTP03_36590 [Tsukamurella sp. PLM1]|nr:hypothetical protein MTP03_36590 [Tsukamurella sp. PLM1]
MRALVLGARDVVTRTLVLEVPRALVVVAVTVPDGAVVVAETGGSFTPDGAVTGPSSKHAVRTAPSASTVTVAPADLRTPAPRSTRAPSVRSRLGTGRAGANRYRIDGELEPARRRFSAAAGAT